MKKMIAPSMMCADFLHLEKDLRVMEAAGIEYLHLDIMDGQFVPNFTLGVDYCSKIKEASAIPLDIHLMITQPESKLDWFGFGEGDLVSVHVESTCHLQRCLQKIKDRGARPMAAINPATPIAVLEDVLDDLDGVLIMTVNPGFAGQALVPRTLDKITRMRQWLDESGHEEVEIEADGNVSFVNAEKMSKAGANIFVAGTSSIFKKGEDMGDNIAALRKAIGSR